MEKKTWNNMTEEERWEYVNQDYIKRTEKFSNPKQIANIFDGDICFPYKRIISSLKREIILLYLSGKSDVDIAWHVNCSKQYVGKILETFGYKRGIDEG